MTVIDNGTDGRRFQQPQHPRPAVFWSPAGPNDGADRRSAPQYDMEGNVLPPPMAYALGTNWLTGVCDCLKDTDSCVDTAFCLYCQLGYQYHRTRRNYVDMDAVVCLAACCADVFVGGLGCTITSAFMRHRITERYRIDESAANMLIKGLCCAPCSVCQAHREMALRGEPPGGVCVGSGSGLMAPSPLPPMGAASAHYATREGRHNDQQPMSPANGTPQYQNTGRPPVNPYYHPSEDGRQYSSNGGSDGQLYASPTSILAPHFAPPRQSSGYGGTAADVHSNPTTPGVVQGTPVYPDTPAGSSQPPETPATAAGGAGGGSSGGRSPWG